MTEISGMPPRPHLVVLPGLGLTRYLERFALEARVLGATVTVLDLPGYGGAGPPVTAPDVRSVGRAAAQWLTRGHAAGPVILFGHSTGAQAALIAALDVQESRRDVTVALAGPTFAPDQRTLAHLLARAPRAYRHDGPWQLDLREVSRAGLRGPLSMVRSGQQDRPEDRIPRLRLPLLLTAGRHDAFAPRWWLEQLARSAPASLDVGVHVLGGSHNNPWTHAADLAALVLGHGERASAAEPVRPSKPHPGSEA